MFKKLARILYFIYIIRRYALYQILSNRSKNAHIIIVYNIFNMLLFFIPKYDKKQPIEVRLRIALEKLGPIFVKLGQMLSIHNDLVGDKIANELSLLQYQVKPFPTNEARNLLEATYNRNLEDVFQDFSFEPLASASVAQVYSANILVADENNQPTSKKVVVKIRRPGISQKIKVDLSIMRLLESIIYNSSFDVGRIRIKEVIDELEYTLLNELDFRNELNNARLLAKNWNDSGKLYIPKVYSKLSSDHVLVMEFVDDIPIFDLDKLHSLDINFKYLAHLGVEIFFTQFLRDNFFHADMHPGNIFINVDDPQKPSYVAVDFGVVGSLSSQDKKYLAENLLAFFKRDYRKVAELHVNSGWVRGKVSLNEFERSICEACDNMFNKPISEISFATVLFKLFEVARSFKMVVQPQLLLLQRTLVYVEGMGRNLYPQLNLWETAKPLLEEWLSEQYSFRPTLDVIKKAPYIAESISYLPDTIYRLLEDNSQILNQIEILHKQNRNSQKKIRLLLQFILLLLFSIMSVASYMFLLPLVITIVLSIGSAYILISIIVNMIL